MPEQHLIIFAIIGVIGLAIIILGFKFSEKTRKVIETTGAIIFHVGVFGILYHKVELNLFISLVALVISLFILIDPLKIGDHLNIKIYRLFGYITLFASVAFSLDFFSGFPVWLWTIPLVIYLSPYLISPLKKRLGLILALSWLVVFSYVGLIAYVIYAKYNPSANVAFIQKYLPQLKIPPSKDKTYSEQDFIYPPPSQDVQQDQSTQTKKQTELELKDKKNLKETTAQKTPLATSTDITKPKAKKLNPKKLTKSLILSPDQTTKTHPSKPAIQTGPYLQSLKEADKKFLRLQTDFDKLKSEYKKVIDENKKLVQEIQKLKGNKKQEVTMETL